MYLAVRRINGAIGFGQTAADERCKAKTLIPGLQRLNAQHAAIEEGTYRTAGVMIVGDHLVSAVIADGALAILIKAVPALPHCCGADSDLIQPAGALGVQ